MFRETPCVTCAEPSGESCPGRVRSGQVCTKGGVDVTEAEFLRMCLPRASRSLRERGYLGLDEVFEVLEYRRMRDRGLELLGAGAVRDAMDPWELYRPAGLGKRLKVLAESLIAAGRDLAGVREVCRQYEKVWATGSSLDVVA